jgi:hypothetical protein
MWSDEINKKIQEAEDSNQPAYTDKAWEGMELLLDKHLPLKKKRRRFIFFLFPLLLGGITALFIWQQKSKPDNPVTEQKRIPVQSSLPPANSDEHDKTMTLPSKETPVTQQNTSGETTENHQAERTPKKLLDDVYTPVKKNKQSQYRQEYGQPKSILKKNTAKKIKDTDNTFSSDKQKPVESIISKPIDNSIANNTVKPVSNDSLATQKNIAPEEKKQEDTVQTETTKTVNKKEKKKTSKGGKFSLNFSAGPDISSVGIDKPGKLKMQYGLGASYSFSERFSIRTGFFAGYKIYTADSADYQPPYTINNLQKINADCFVYEIPVTLVYNFAATKKHNWFISGGVSSYIMKKETYEYYYKNPWGQTQNYSHTYKNKNSHLFSVINISGGYQHHFTDRFSIMAEPYVKIPVTGIGVGKVKLNSAGVLFTVGFKPFLNKN